MTNIDLVSFVITLISSVMSISLAIFAIWLSKSFDENSSKSLKNIDSLVSEIRSLVDVGLSQQKTFSEKMLDSILSKDKYGNEIESELNVTAEVLTNKLKENEDKIIKTIETMVLKKGSTEEQFTKAIGEIKQSIQDINNEAAATVINQNKLPYKFYINRKLLTEFPAHILILVAIVKEDIKTLEELQLVVDKYNIPNGWDSGLENLIKNDILKGDINKFWIGDKNLIPIAKWIDKNWSTIDKLKECYLRDKSENISRPVSNEELSIVSNLIF